MKEKNGMNATDGSNNVHDAVSVNQSVDVLWQLCLFADAAERLLHKCRPEIQSFRQSRPCSGIQREGMENKNAAVAKPMHACATTRHPDVTRCARKHAKRRDLHRQIQPHGVQAVLCLELVNPAAARFALGIFPARLDALFEQEVIGALLQL